MVANVKKYRNGLVMDPIVFKNSDTIQYVMDTKEKLKLSFSGFPITHTGKPHDYLVGLLSKRDIDLARLLVSTGKKIIR